jgi:hypothetical protein
MFSAGLGNTFWHFDIDKLEVFSAFYFMSWAKQVNYNIRIADHTLDLVLIFVVHAVVDPGAMGGTASAQLFEVFGVSEVVTEAERQDQAAIGKSEFSGDRFAEVARCSEDGGSNS